MTDRNIDIALRIKADLDAAQRNVEGFNTTLESTGKTANTSATALSEADKRINTLTDSMQQTAAATAVVESATAAVTVAIRDLAESEEDAVARIRAVIAASRDQVAAAQAVAASSTEATASARGHAESADAVAASITRQNAQLRQSSVAAAEAAASERQAAVATEDHAGELAKLLGQLDPTIAAFERLDQAEAQLLKYRNLKLLDDEAYQRFQTQIETSRAAVGRLGVSSGQTAQAMRQLPAQITDVTVSLASGMPVWLVFLQQGGQIKDSFGGWKPALQNILSLLTPTRILLGSTAVAATGLAVAMVQGYLQAQRLESTLLATGNYAGETATQLVNLSQRIGATQGNYSDASKAVLQLAESGKVTRDQLDDAARGAVAFAQVAGVSIDDAAKKVISLSDKPAQSIRALDEQYHFLETDIYAQIQALAEQGRQTDAAALAQKTFADAMDDRRRRDDENLGAIQRAWKSLNDEIQRGYDVIKNIGAQSVQQQLAQLYAKRGMLDNWPDLLVKDKRAAIDAQIAALKEQASQEDKTAEAEAKHRQEQEAGNAAMDRVAQTTAKYATAAEKYQKELDQINANFDAAIKATPAKADQLNAQRGDQLRRAVAAYAETLKPPKRASDADARAGEVAQEALLKSLQNLQGQLDPTAAAWAKYNEAVDTANKQAQVAKKAPGANAAAIDAERNAVVQLAASVRDTDIQKIADKNREAWEKLLGTLGTPAEVKVGKAVEDIKQLNTLLASGTGTADQYKTALDNIGKNSVIALPSYLGVDGAVGGVTSELSKNFKAQADLDKWHQQAMAANEAFRQGDTANEEAYQAGLAQIRDQYAQRSNQIEADRQQLQLTTTSNLFGQLATLQQSNNTKIAAVGKAAAISKSIIDTYQSATAAYASLASIPYVGPALGTAAAAAAIAAGLANVAQIRSQNTSFAGGGEISGPGTKTSDSIPIWASDGEFMQRAAAVDYYGVDFMHAVNNLQLPRHAFADGGYISALADAPRISVAAAPAAPRIGAAGVGTNINNRMRVYLSLSEDELRKQILQHPSTEKAVVAIAAQNGRAIQAEW